MKGDKKYSKKSEENSDNISENSEGVYEDISKIQENKSEYKIIIEDCENGYVRVDKLLILPF